MGKRAYYAFENTLNHGKLSVDPQKIPFRRFGGIGASQWGGKYRVVASQNQLDTGSLPIEIMAMDTVVDFAQL